MDKEYSSSTITDKEVYVDRVDTRPDDSGTGWAVALIVLILAIGFAFVAFSNNQSMNELKTSQSIDQLRRDNQSLTNSVPQFVPPVSAPATSNVEVKAPEVKAPEVKPPEKAEVPSQVDVNVTPAPAPAEDQGAAQ